MRSKLANLIKTRRKALNLSQKELAEGICTQTIISRLEKGEVNPSVDIFFKIVKKLTISMEEVAELFEVDMTESNNILYSEEINELVYKREYKTLRLILNNINADNLKNSDKLFYEYLTSTLIYFLDKNIELALDKLKSLLKKIQVGSLLYCRITATIGNFHTEQNNFASAIEYFESILPYVHIIEDTDFEQGFYYSISRAYGMTGRLREATKWNSLAISKLLEEKSFFKLGNNYYLQARLFEEEKLYANAVESCTKAINIYQIENDEIMKNMALSYLSHLKEKINNEEK